MAFAFLFLWRGTVDMYEKTHGFIIDIEDETSVILFKICIMIQV